MKRFISPDFIVVFIGGFLFLHKWSVSVILNFIIFFTFCFFYLWFDQRNIFAIKEQKSTSFYWHKKILLFVVIGLVLGMTLGADILSRAEDPSLPVHDNVWQVEPAINFLLEGKNPYTQDFFGTDLEKMKYISTTTHQRLINPALFHLIKLPFHILLSVPFYFFLIFYLVFMTKESCIYFYLLLVY